MSYVYWASNPYLIVYCKRVCTHRRLSSNTCTRGCMQITRHIISLFCYQILVLQRKPFAFEHFFLFGKFDTSTVYKKYVLLLLRVFWDTMIYHTYTWNKIHKTRIILLYVLYISFWKSIVKALDKFNGKYCKCTSGLLI